MRAPTASFALISAAIALVAIAGRPILRVTPSSVILSQGSSIATVQVTNAGEGTMIWTASSDNPGATVKPDRGGGDSTRVTVFANDFRVPYSASALVTFTPVGNPSNSQLVLSPNDGKYFPLFAGL